MSKIIPNDGSNPSIVAGFGSCGEYSLLSSVLSDSGSQASGPLPVTSLVFDTLEELLWMGNAGGHITSYYGYQLQKYTSFQVHAVNDIRSMITGPFGILSLTSNSIRLSIRRGLNAFTHTSELLKDMQCMACLPSGLILIGGQQKQLVEFDLERVKLVRLTEIEEEGCVIVRQHPKFLCCGDVAGKITLRDTNSLKVQHTFSTHSVTLSDFDVRGNYLVSCGYSNRHNFLADRFLMVYDLRMMRSIAPIQMMFPPYLLRFVPAFSSRFCVVSQSGQFQILDATSSSPSPFIHNVVLPAMVSITAFDVSSSCQALAFSDESGCIHLYGASDEVNFNNFSQETEFADPIEPSRPIAYDDIMTPYSSILMPYVEDEKLLSDWPSELCKPAYRLPKPIDPQILSTMKMVKNICYAPNPGSRGNQMPYVPETNRIKHSKSPHNVNDNDIVPLRYQMIEPDHNKIIMDEYDFTRFNHTGYTGLDPTLPNSYSNNLIQVLYYMPLLRNAISSHRCNREFCLACEFSFLFYMIETSSFQVPCQANNFLRAFRTIPEASALSLILPEDDDLRKKVNFSQLAQSWLRFILHQLHSELSLTGIENTVPQTRNNSVSIITELFGIEEVCHYKCKCGNSWEQKTIKYPLTLLYPDEVMTLDQSIPFTTLLSKSLNGEQILSAHCGKCNKFQYVIQTRKAKSLPDILAINCGLDGEKGMKFWKYQWSLIDGEKGSNKLPESNSSRKPCRYGDKCSRGDCKFSHEKDLHCVAPSPQPFEAYIPMKMLLKLDTLDVSACESTAMEGLVEYQLVNIVSVIKKPGECGKDNIVSIIKIEESYQKFFEKSRNIPPLNSDWLLFNHFCITQVSSEEVTHVDLAWKLPSIITYYRRDLTEKHKYKGVCNPITAEVFQDDRNLASGHRSSITFIPLEMNEMPKKGDIVAMDAEFVTLNQEETEIRSDGTRTTIKPPQRSVARITCVRGSGPLEGQPFVDDYIATQEQVADYMTKFSGIQPGDLDVAISSKHLTTLKSTYLKLRFLVDNGVIFVGHGLKNDFKVINLVVPQDQIIDTVTLFQSPRFKRMVSLRFLAWHFLGEKIQSETHDSIEDAKTALSLYRKYEELKLHDRVEESIEELYEAGRNSGWKVPED